MVVVVFFSFPLLSETILCPGVCPCSYWQNAPDLIKTQVVTYWTLTLVLQRMKAISDVRAEKASALRKC